MFMQDNLDLTEEERCFYVMNAMTTFREVSKCCRQFYCTAGDSLTLHTCRHFFLVTNRRYSHSQLPHYLEESLKQVKH